jgi:hypothetical protein
MKLNKSDFSIVEIMRNVNPFVPAGVNSNAAFTLRFTSHLQRRDYVRLRPKNHRIHSISK